MPGDEKVVSCCFLPVVVLCRMGLCMTSHRQVTQYEGILVSSLRQQKQTQMLICIGTIEIEQ